MIWISILLIAKWIRHIFICILVICVFCEMPFTHISKRCFKHNLDNFSFLFIWLSNIFSQFLFYILLYIYFFVLYSTLLLLFVLMNWSSFFKIQFNLFFIQHEVLNFNVNSSIFSLMVNTCVFFKKNTAIWGHKGSILCFSLMLILYLPFTLKFFISMEFL